MIKFYSDIEQQIQHNIYQNTCWFFFPENGKLMLKFMWECKGPRKTKTKLEDSHVLNSQLTTKLR